MRRGVVVALVLLAAGCGGANGTQPVSKPAARGHGDSRPVTFRPAEPNGFWRKLERSPDLRWWLGQWSGECEAQSTYLIPVRGGRPRAIVPGGESYALGWRGRRARILLPRAACGGNGDLKPGIYLVDPATLKLTLVRRLKGRPGGA